MPEVRGWPGRVEHIMGMPISIDDPHTGRPPEGVLSVTIVGPDLATADALRHGRLRDGPCGPPWTARLVGYEAMTILSDETVLWTRGFPTA